MDKPSLFIRDSNGLLMVFYFFYFGSGLFSFTTYVRPERTRKARK